MNIFNHSFDHIVYISHPFQNNPNNKEIVENLIINLQKQFPTYLFVSPIHTFSFLYNEVTYTQGLNMCLWLLNYCDEMWVFGDYKNSTGCLSEITFCKNHKIYYQIISDNCLQIKGEPRKCADCGLCAEDEQWIACIKNGVAKIYRDVVKNIERSEVSL